MEDYAHERRRVLDDQDVSIWLRSAVTALDNLPADEANLLLMLTALRAYDARNNANLTPKLHGETGSWSYITRHWR